VIYIKKGNVKVCVTAKDGKEAVVAHLRPDEFLGEGCLIGQARTHFAEGSAPRSNSSLWQQY
jgi:CRP-like cAMP-binding protein